MECSGSAPEAFRKNSAHLIYSKNEKGRQMQKMMKRAAGIGLVILVMTGTAYAGKPLQIYLLAGQSNMEGQASR